MLYSGEVGAYDPGLPPTFNSLHFVVRVTRRTTLMCIDYELYHKASRCIWMVVVFVSLLICYLFDSQHFARCRLYRWREDRCASASDDPR